MFKTKKIEKIEQIDKNEKEEISKKMEKYIKKRKDNKIHIHRVIVFVSIIAFSFLLTFAYNQGLKSFKANEKEQVKEKIDENKLEIIRNEKESTELWKRKKTIPEQISALEEELKFLKSEKTAIETKLEYLSSKNTFLDKENNVLQGVALKK